LSSLEQVFWKFTERNCEKSEKSEISPGRRMKKGLFTLNSLFSQGFGETMGRLLEIAQTVPVTNLVEKSAPRVRLARPAADHTKNKIVCEKSEIGPPATYSQPSADVLNILVTAGEPVLHSQLVKALMERGRTKRAAYAAIADCQSHRWIEHDLVKGYVLKGGTLTGADPAEERQDAVPALIR